LSQTWAGKVKNQNPKKIPDGGSSRTMEKIKGEKEKGMVAERLSNIGEALIKKKTRTTQGKRKHYQWFKKVALSFSVIQVAGKGNHLWNRDAEEMTNFAGKARKREAVGDGRIG